MTYRPIDIPAGVNPDNTALSSPMWYDMDKMRFWDGKPESLGGWDSYTFNSGTISGCCRIIFSKKMGSNQWTLLGTHQKLYSLLGTELTNITPLIASTTTLGSNPIQTDYTTLGSDPLDVTISSTTVTVNQTAHLYQAGDSVVMSGATATGGVPAGDFNKTHIVRTVDTNSYTIIVATAGTSTASGGGASVVIASGVVTVTDATHGMADGDRIKVLAATTTGGITDAQINLEHIIRNADTNTYDIVTAGTATSSAAGGGASVTRQEEIADGQCDALLGRGYGMGKFGVGKYGVSKTSTNLLIEIRTPTMDRYGDNVIMTFGGQTGLYQWTGDTATAPVLVTNAPTAINYAFTSDNIVVTFGDSDVDNRLKWSDQGDNTSWTSTSTNKAGADDIEGANKFISHAPIRGGNLLFCKDQIWTFRFINRPLIWETKLLENGIGIIGQNARVVYKGTVFFMGQDNFYMYSGGAIQAIPSNLPSGVNPIRKHVFNNLNTEQSAKCFAWKNDKFEEIWFHYPTGTECDKYVIFNTKELTWSIGSMDRTAAEYPTKISQYEKLIDSANTLYRHEKGVDDDVSALNSYIETNYMTAPEPTFDITGVIPDSVQTGSITLTPTTKLYPQSSTSTTLTAETITATTERVDFTLNGRQRKYKIAQNEIGASWRMGAWYEKLEGASDE